MRSTVSRAVLLCAATFALILGLAPAALAEITGGCQATIAGQSVADRSSSDPSQAIPVDYKQTVTVSATSSAPISGYQVKLEFAGFRKQVASGSANGNTWSSTVEVSKYAPYATGIFRVLGSSSGPGACTGAALIKITGKNPLTTVAGAAAAGLAGAGALGILASAATAIRSPKRLIGDRAIRRLADRVPDLPSNDLVRGIRSEGQYVDAVQEICTKGAATAVQEICTKGAQSYFQEICTKGAQWGVAR